MIAIPAAMAACCAGIAGGRYAHQRQADQPKRGGIGAATSWRDDASSANTTDGTTSA